MTALTTTDMLAITAALDIQTLPTALAMYPGHADHGQWVQTQRAAVSDLADRGVWDDDLTSALFALARPDRELTARIIRGDEVIRFCLVRRGFDHAVAVRTGDRLDVCTVWADDDPMTLTRPLLAVLGPCLPADIPTFRAPTADLRRLDAEGSDYATTAHSLGMSEDDAVTLGLALRERHTTTEIVCYGHRTGRGGRSPATAAVYDTAVGRIVAGGSVTAAGQTWTTMAPGSDHRMAQVIAVLTQTLPEGRWMP